MVVRSPQLVDGKITWPGRPTSLTAGERRPDLLLRKVLDRYPSGFWKMNPTLTSLKAEAEAALAATSIDLDLCKSLVTQISRSRHRG